MSLHHVISLKLALAGTALVTAGAAAVFGSVGGKHAAPRASEPALTATWARAPIVPAGDPELATDWVPTTDGHLRLRFSYHRAESGCAGPCERFQLMVEFTEPGVGDEGSGRWLAMVHASCVTFGAGESTDRVCEGGYPLAGRDRRGTDYVLLPLYASREQLVRMAADDPAFDLGGSRFRLTPAATEALRHFLGTAGRALPR